MMRGRNTRTGFKIDPMSSPRRRGSRRVRSKFVRLDSRLGGNDGFETASCVAAAGFIIAMGAMLSASGCGSAPAAAPTAYGEYNSPGGTFACEYPDGWQADGGGKRGLEWAKFKSGSSEIRVDTGVAGSLMGDIAGTLGGKTGEEELGPEFEPVHDVHIAGQDWAEKEYSGYKEVGEPAVLDVRVGPARSSEFTASSTFGSGLHGYRATMLGNDKAVTVICVCPESDWKTLQPAFDHVLSTFKRGVAE
jgi:hypothetical protein